MIKILFVCHGNICRSPAAEFIMKDLVKKAGLEGEFEIASAAVSSEETGNPVYPPMRRLLNKRGIDCSGKTAVRITKGDLEHYDLIITMDRSNISYLRRYFHDALPDRVKNLLDYAGRYGEEVDDPWYSGDFATALADIEAGCRGLLAKCTGAKNF